MTVVFLDGADELKKTQLYDSGSLDSAYCFGDHRRFLDVRNFDIEKRRFAKENGIPPMDMRMQDYSLRQDQQGVIHRRIVEVDQVLQGRTTVVPRRDGEPLHKVKI